MPFRQFSGLPRWQVESIDNREPMGYYTIMTNDITTKERKGMGLTQTKFRHRGAAAAVMKRYVEKTGWNNLTIRQIRVKLDSGLDGVRFIIVRKQEEDYATR